MKSNIMISKRKQHNNKKYSIKAKKHNLYEKSVQEPWFSLIAMGVKKIEGRPNKGFFKDLKKGDIVTWTNDITGKVRKIKTLITNIRLYKTFYEMIETEKLVNVLPATGAGINTVTDGVNKVYRQWYNEEVEQKYGICAIEMDII